MAQLPVCFAEVKTALFIAGTNLKQKLDPFNNPGLGLVYDQAEKELVISWKNTTTIVPTSNVASMTLGVAKDRKVVQIVAPQTSGIMTAQVETPMSHVHAGPGKGKTKA